MSKDALLNAPTLVPQNSATMDDINVYWDVTIKAGETQSFMMVLVQNRFSIQETLDNATYIDSNPLKIYDGKDETLIKNPNCEISIFHIYSRSASNENICRLVLGRVVHASELQCMCGISFRDSERDLIVHHYRRISDTEHHWLRPVVPSRAR